MKGEACSRQYLDEWIGRDKYDEDGASGEQWRRGGNELVREFSQQAAAARLRP